MKILNFLLSCLLFIKLIGYCDCVTSITFQTKASCQDTATTTPKYFNSASLQCEDCSTIIATANTLQVSTDLLSCRCKPRYYMNYNFGGKNIECLPCGNQQVTSFDGWSCISCQTWSAETSTCVACNSTSISVEREIYGKPYTSRTCELCQDYTQPDDQKKQCLRCSQTISLYSFARSPSYNSSNVCSCPGGTLTGGVCFPTPTDLVEIGTSIKSLDKTSIESYYFVQNAKAIFGMCKIYANVSACQSLGNLCVLQLYSLNDNLDACSLFRTLTSGRSPVNGIADWVAGLPWLYFDTVTPLQDTAITAQFTTATTINFQLTSYSLNGTFLGYVSALNGLLQMCPDTVSRLNAAYLFGNSYSQSCSLNVDDLFDNTKYPLVFYDIFLQYTSTANLQVAYPVPVRVLNYLDTSSNTPNTDTDSTNWKLTRRFFLVDNVAGLTQKTQNSASVVGPLAELVRYASDITITLSPQPDQTNGKILPPLITINYTDIKYADSYGQQQTVQVNFNVVYSATTTTFEYNLTVAMGVLCALAACMAALKTWSWSRRAGIMSMDVVTVVKLLAHACAAISNVFVLVMFCVCFYFVVFYKNQVIVSIFIPTVAQENFLVIYLSVAVGLKVLDVAHLLAAQCTIDIFFVDWEPRKATTSGNHAHQALLSPQDAAKVDQAERGEVGADNPAAGSKNSKLSHHSHGDSSPVWRTYFAANEWNEIQTFRKTWPVLTLFVVIFFMEVVGFKNLATADAQSAFVHSDANYYSPDSRIFRIGIIGTIFIIIGVLQWVFNLVIYEKFFEDKLRNYVDLCSVSNVSVFIMAQRQFGYYIHGHSVHGTAEVGLRSIYEQLQKERDNLCSKRGLEMDSDQQTFVMALPVEMRINFDRLYAPFSEGHSVEKGLDTYVALNTFLTSFISRSNSKSMTFQIVNRRLLEDVLDFEIDDSSQSGHLYRDDGNSFGDVLFYGNELTLFTLDLLVFFIVDIIWQNSVLDAVITWIIQWIVAAIRNGASKSNLAKKTLVDKRFLI